MKYCEAYFHISCFQMDRKTYLFGCPRETGERTEWTEFVKLVKDISKEQDQFVLPSSLYHKCDGLHRDEIAKQLMPSDSN